MLLALEELLGLGELSLSDQVLSVLIGLQPLDGNTVAGGILFPSQTIVQPGESVI